MSTIAVLLAANTVAPAALAHTITQKLGSYQDNGGMQRERVAFDATVDGAKNRGALTDSSYSLSLSQDTYQDHDVAEDDAYTKEVYGEGYRVNDAASVSATQTWDRITETRVMGAYSTDRHVKTRSWAAGASEWTRHETVRVGFDLSRTIVEQPFYEILDYDSREVGNPTIASSTGATVSVRHLATSTTIMDYSASHVATDNRPDSNSGTVGVRQFVPPANGAVHVSATRAVNRGYIGTDTSYGQVDAWIVDTAWLQNLWTGARARLGYRYYKEDETTRVYEDEKVFGSDTVSLGFSQEIPKGAVDNLPGPLTVEAAAARYVTNTNVAARSYEVGVAAKF